jgi:hypothetical protein
MVVVRVLVVVLSVVLCGQPKLRRWHHEQSERKSQDCSVTFHISSPRGKMPPIPATLPHVNRGFNVLRVKKK